MAGKRRREVSTKEEEGPSGGPPSGPDVGNSDQIAVLQAMRERWAASASEVWQAGDAWAEAADALVTRPDSYGFLVSAVSAESDLRRAEDEALEARAWGMAVQGPEQPLGPALAAMVSSAGVAMVARWNAKVDETSLGAGWRMRDGSLHAAAAFVARVQEPARELARDAEFIREKAASVPADRPQADGLALQRTFHHNAARDALSGVLLSLDERYGHEWLFLMEQAVQGGLPEWAIADLQREVGGAAQYEAHLQDQGALQVDQDKIDRLAQLFRRSTEGVSPDVWRLLNEEIRNLTRVEIAALEAQYQERFDMMLTVELHHAADGEDYEEAFRSLTGDPVWAAVEALENRMDDERCNPVWIAEVLSQIPPSERARFQEMRQTDPELQALERRILSADYFGDRNYNYRAENRPDRAWLEAWFAHDVARAEAIGLEMEALDRTYRDMNDPGGAGWHTAELGGREVVDADVGRLVEQLEESEDPRALEAAFDASHDYTLREWIAESGKPDQRVLALALLDQDPIRATAARVRLGDGQGMRRALYDPALTPESAARDPEAHAAALRRRERLDQEFAAAFEGESVRGWLEQRYTDEQERAQALRVLETGEESIAIGAWMAMEGAGTDEDWLRELVRGKSKAQMARAAQEYAALTGGRDLIGDMRGELDDDEDELAEIMLLARGLPETPEQILEYASERHRQLRSGGSMQDLTDFVEENLFGSQTGQDMDRAYQLLSELYGSSVDPRRAAQIYGWHAVAADDHRVARAQVTEAIARGVEIAAVALATLATDGALAPWLVRVIAALAGAAAYTGTKVALTGNTATVPVDLAVGVASAALAGLVEARILAGAAETGQGLRMLFLHADEAGELGKVYRDRVLRQALAIVVENGGNAAVQAAFSEETWAQGLDAGMLAVVASVLREAGVSLFAGAIGGETRTGQFLAETGTTWIVEQPEDAELVAFVVHSVLEAGAAATGWASEPLVERRAKRAEEKAGALSSDQVDAFETEKDRIVREALSDPSLSQGTRERLQAWAERYRARDLAFDTLALAPSEAADPWKMRHTGQMAMYRGQLWTVLANEPGSFLLTRPNPDGAPIIARVNDEALLASPANGHLLDELPADSAVTTQEAMSEGEANAIYWSMLRDAPGREAAIFRHEGGAHVAVQGDEGSVSAEAATWRELLEADGVWTMVAHHQPEVRLPSGSAGDIGVLVRTAQQTGERTRSRLDARDPQGEWTETWFSYDPDSGQVRLEWLEQGRAMQRSFADVAAYDAWLQRQGLTTGGAPGRAYSPARDLARQELLESVASGIYNERTGLTAEHFTPDQLVHYLETGEVPEGMEFSHLWAVCEAPERRDDPDLGVLVPRAEHRRGHHGGDTRQSPQEFYDPEWASDPEELGETGLQIYDADDRNVRRHWSGRQ